MTYIFHIVFMVKDVFKQGLGCEREKERERVRECQKHHFTLSRTLIMFTLTFLLSVHAPLTTPASSNTWPNLSERGE